MMGPDSPGGYGRHPRIHVPEQARVNPSMPGGYLALGTMLYELLCGDPPFTGSDKLRIMQQQASEKPKRPSDFAPGVEISKPLEAVVMQAIAKKSATRFQSTADFISALDTASRPDRLTPMPSPALSTSDAQNETGLSRLHEWGLDITPSKRVGGVGL